MYGELPPFGDEAEDFHVDSGLGNFDVDVWADR